MEENHQAASSPPPPPPPPPQAFPQHPSFHQLLQQQHQQLHMFWNYQRQAMEGAADFKNHQLPLARIKKIMKADEDVRMISAEAPILFAKACELFILELTIRSWLHAEENKRRTLQKNDIAAAITRTEVFDFLVDLVPREEIKGIVVAPPPQRGEGAGVSCYCSAVGAEGMYGGQPPGIGWWGEEEEEEETEGFGGFDGGGMEVREGFGGVGNAAPPPPLPPLPPPSGF